VRKGDGLSHIFIDFYVPAHTPYFSSTETSLQLSENITLLVVCCIYTHTHVISKEPRHTLGVQGVSFIQYCTMWGTGQNLVAPLLYIPLHRHFIFGRDSEFSPRKKNANKLD
jgi:hypothetical protein